MCEDLGIFTVDPSLKGDNDITWLLKKVTQLYTTLIQTH